VTQPPHPELGAALHALKEKRGLTQVRLARISGVSRRHVALALAGGNVTITVLKKLMHALQADSIQIGEVERLGTQLGNVSPSVLLAIAEQIERGMTIAAGAAATLRTYAYPSGLSAPVHEKAAALVRDFTTHVHTISDPQRLAAIERAMGDALHGEDRGSLGERPVRRRRTRSA
jgi:transcriptional regulator with XRE-family HTH domain